MAQRKEWMLRPVRSALSHPSHLWGGRAHRERSERCDGWGVSSVRELPPPGASRHPKSELRSSRPHEDGGRERAAALSFECPNSETHLEVRHCERSETIHGAT